MSMNNNETPNTPFPSESTPETPTQPVQPAIPQEPISSTTPPQAMGSEGGVWVPKAEYDAYAAAQEKVRTDEQKRSKKIHAFYVYLAISGFLLFVLYIGLLIAPGQYITKGECVTGFTNIAFWLNPVAYLFFFHAGSVGVATKHHSIRPLGIIMMIIAPIAWFMTGVVILNPILCGV